MLRVTLTRGEVQRLLETNGLRPSRALGQNFVVDPNTTRRIARLADLHPGEPVLEVGAGVGSLTLALAEAGAEVLALEVDRGLVPVLRQVVAGQTVAVEEADAMEVDLAALLGAHRPDAVWSMVANLPYNVATPLVMRVLEEVPTVRRLLVMVQREVAERLAAAPGTHAYGAVSARVAYFATAALVGRVPPTVFVPRPRVESALVRLERLPAPAVDPSVVSYEQLRAVMQAGFGQRRKMLRRSLQGVVPTEAFAASGIAPEARAEELSVEQWGKLAAWGTLEP
jgi:16S rRNA (adenine1518-N6/adenine1519-N6)-dimethyltransferase